MTHCVQRNLFARAMLHLLFWFYCKEFLGFMDDLCFVVFHSIHNNPLQEFGLAIIIGENAYSMKLIVY